MSKYQTAARSAEKLIVLTSHPIQYQAPLWREMAKALHFDRGHFDNVKDDERGGGIPFEVWFLTDQGVRRTEDKDFGKAFAWDVDLLSGYPHRFLELSGQWDLHRFNGIPLAKPIGESLREVCATALWVEGWRFKPFWDAVSAAKKMGIPVFLRGETSDKIPEKGGLFGLVRKFALHRLFGKVDHFLAIGQASRRFYRRHGVPEAKLLDAPYCVDNAFFRAEAGKIRGLQDNGTTGLREEGKREEQLRAADQETKRLRDEELKRPKDQEAKGAGGARSADLERDNCDILTEGQRAIREEWKIPLDAKVVMFCGKFVGKKRPGDVVRAAQVHQTTGPQDNRLTRNPWHLLFVGSGELGDELRAACDVRFGAESSHCADHRTTGPQDHGIEQALGDRQAGRKSSSLEPRVSSRARDNARPPASFVGFLNQSQISKAYAVADVVVLPSEAWETWGLVVNEATAAGVQTVVSDQCGCSDDFGARNPYTTIFPTGDVAAMAAAIDRVLASKAKPEEVTRFADSFSPRITSRIVAKHLAG